ncbi:MAG: DivIVA domain-containing protein [Actinomycetota bacterium]|nr:DivIVA domain-containing protein [Actinomycetota bacterium]MEC9181781.1 DivIVA domain-containing protein [Actinomycetota bacterium]MED5298518.1 DivIVA domain-containing protein [Actinomycetota bacterium]MEE3069111.1 DivIVA domain-containing protein [Actinomycetota bacterium]
MDASSPNPSSPDSISQATFPPSRKGFDQERVRAFLVAVAAEMQVVIDENARLSSELDEAERRAVNLAKMDDELLQELLGEEKARTLVSAREETRVERAEMRARLREIVEEADRHVEQANLKIARLRESARLWAEETELHQRRLAEQFDRARALAADVVAVLDPQSIVADVASIEEMPMMASDALSDVFDGQSDGDGHGESAVAGAESSSGEGVTDDGPSAEVVPLFPGRQRETEDVLVDVGISTPRLDEVISNELAGVVRSVKKAFADELDVVLAALDSDDEKKRRTPLPGPAAYRKRHVKLMTSAFTAAAEAGAADLGSDSVDGEAACAAAIAVVDEQLLSFVRGQVMQTIKDHGDDQRAIVKSVRAAYREVKGERVESALFAAMTAAYETAQR